MTSKLQVTIPKAIADSHGIAPGDEIDWVSTGDTIRVVPHADAGEREIDYERRVELFDQDTERLREIFKSRRLPPSTERGWKREDLYDRGFPR